MSQKHADLLKLLLPPVAYDITGPALRAEVDALGAQLDAAQAITDALLIEIDPRTTTILLDDWERVYGLPDACSGVNGTIEQRRAALVSKVANTGGVSKGHFLQLAELLGYRNTSIQTFVPTHCEMHCESAVRSVLWRFAWQVNLPHAVNNYTAFRADGRADERIDSYALGELECRFMTLKPAHTYVIFSYEGSAV